jgi:hypothetical protein
LKKKRKFTFAIIKFCHREQCGCLLHCPTPGDDFDGREKGILDFVISHVCNHHSANSISELSHDAIWDAANDGEEIPMFATLVSDSAELTPEVIKWAQDIVGKVTGRRNAA